MVGLLAYWLMGRTDAILPEPHISHEMENCVGHDDLRCQQLYIGMIVTVDELRMSNEEVRHAGRVPSWPRELQASQATNDCWALRANEGMRFRHMDHCTRIVEFRIPKRLHYVWVGSSLPDKQRRLIDGWRDLHRDFEVVGWNEFNIDMDNPLIKSAYARRRWATVAVCRQAVCGI